MSLKAGQTQAVPIALNGTGKRLLARRHALKARLVVAQPETAAATTTVSVQTVTFKKPKQVHAHRTH